MEDKIKQLCDQVRETAYAIHKFQIKKFVMDKAKRITSVPKALSLLFSFASFALFRG